MSIIQPKLSIEGIKEHVNHLQSAHIGLIKKHIHPPNPENAGVHGVTKRMSVFPNRLEAPNDEHPQEWLGSTIKVYIVFHPFLDWMA